MLIKNIRNIMVSVAGVAVATSAMAEGAAPTVYGEFRTELTRKDDGLAKIEDGGKSVATAMMNLNDVKFGLKGKFNERTSYNFKLNFTDTANIIDLANATWKASDMFAVTMGRDYVRQGGFSNWDNSFDNIWGDRIQALAFSRNATSLSLNMTPSAGHNVTIQLVNDIMTDDPTTTAANDGPAKYNSAHKQPAAILEYTGDFGPIKPIVQFGQYDMNHSSFYNVGARGNFGATALSFDYGANSASMPVGTSDKAAVATNMTLRAEHEVGSMVPFVWFNSFNVVDKDVNPAGTETKTNTAGVWNDNATQISVGSSFKNFGDNWTPYVAYRMTSGKFLSTEAVEKSGSESELGLGVTGKF